MKTVVKFPAAGAAGEAPAAADAVITMIASNAMREPCGRLLPAFERRSGGTVAVSWGGTPDIVSRVESGEIADIVIVPAARIDDLVAKNLIASRTDLVRSGIGVAVRAGVPKPDVSRVAALKTALEAARSIVLSSGPSSLYLPTLFERLGIAEAVKPKIIQIAPGLGVGATLARGEGEIGFTQVSELVSVKGIQYLGPLPAEVQHYTVFSAGLRAGAPDTARRLVRFLVAADAVALLKSHGMEPA
jgi:molybdate transport system substrate-binding protein